MEYEITNGAKDDRLEKMMGRLFATELNKFKYDNKTDYLAFLNRLDRASLEDHANSIGLRSIYDRKELIERCGIQFDQDQSKQRLMSTANKNVGKSPREIEAYKELNFYKIATG